jgi:hypothetical protein
VCSPKNGVSVDASQPSVATLSSNSSNGSNGSIRSTGSNGNGSQIPAATGSALNGNGVSGGNGNGGNGNGAARANRAAADGAALAAAEAAQVAVAKAQFLQQWGNAYGYGGRIDRLYAEEVGRRMPPHEHYLDYTGSSLYCNSVLQNVFQDLQVRTAAPSLLR